jgi:hypothetical protein
MYAVISLNDAKYQPLADMTWTQNKQIYCDRHGYEGILKTDKLKGGIPIGFEKIFWMLDLMTERQDIEWFWWTGTDAMITNHTIKIEDKIIPEYDLIMATDCNEINNDSFLIKNSEWGRAYMKSITEVVAKYSNHYFYEQQAMIDSVFLEENKGKIKIVPQRYLNAYQNSLYPHQSKYDCLGNDGTWQQGDWLIHWPGTSLEKRLELAKVYLDRVVK